MTDPVAGSLGVLEIQNRTFDSTRWNLVKLRDDDIVIATWGKTGTTLTQQMVSQLITGGSEGMYSFAGSAWVDARFYMPAADMAAIVEAQTQRRFLKTHLPFDAVPFDPRVKYIYVGRDARDVLWSAYNHHTSQTDAWRDNINSLEGPWPKIVRTTLDVRDYYLQWLDTDTTPGFLGISFWSHVQSWWDQRQQPNVLLLHYANLIVDPSGELRRMAGFLGIDVDEARLPVMVEHCGIDYMRAEASKSPRMAMSFEDGAASFFNKGTNGRWRDVLSPEEIARCDEVAATRLSPDCAQWLKTGRWSF